MQEDIILKLSEQLNIKTEQIQNTLKLLEEGCTVPFIARYRKELTHGLDEEQIRVIQEQYDYQVNLKKRKEEVLTRIETLGHLNDDIVKMVNACTRLSQVEDIYRPYKQKKKTRASVAIAAGLEPLAKTLLSLPRTFNEKDIDAYLNDTITSREEALQGAKDIIAEKISNDMTVRNKIVDSMMNYGRLVTSKKKNAEDEKMTYKMYYDYSENVSRIATHRIMAIDRGEKEKILTVSININEDYIKTFVSRRYIKFPKSPTAKYVDEAIDDGLPDGWCKCRLEDIVEYEQPQAYIVNSTDYDDRYLTPVLTAGKSFVIGYTNETEGIYQNTPCIIFDDFTTDSKLVDFPFKVKSSAMKILKVADDIEIEYVAMFMNITRLIGDTHKRYWISEYSKLCIPIPPKEEQKRIINAANAMFEKLDAIIESL